MTFKPKVRFFNTKKSDTSHCTENIKIMGVFCILNINNAL